MSVFIGVKSPVLSCLTELSKSLNTALLKSTIHKKHTYLIRTGDPLIKMVHGAQFPKLQDQYATTVQSTHVKTFIKCAKIINIIIVLHTIKVHD